ncbi:MAG: glutamine--fructose-6-phosphate transaminase (isomerizing) [Deltaproteobacteria bacterium]|nr:glutamine--fructose-6-phosphate transaminase (isomerizing) [Deltaproteobacteria bacterium]
MCGIVGYIGRERSAMDVLIDGLRRLEYRGYDSAGVAILDEGSILVRRALGKLTNLEGVLRDNPVVGHVGIGHTRWATHGKPSERNAHPHCSGSVSIVHNGIVENYRQLRAELESAGRTVESETDTELIAHLIDLRVEAGDDLLSAARAACSRLTGSYAFAIVSSRDPDHIVAAKNGGSPIILGLGEKESFLASDIPAILPYTRQMISLRDGEFAVLSSDRVELIDSEGRPIEREPIAIQWDPVSAEKGGYDRFMQKEIFEQPRAVLDTIGTRISEEGCDVDLDGVDIRREDIESITRIHLVACGTAYYSCMVGKFFYEQIAGISTEVDLASEFRYRRPALDEGCVLIAVSQSGETADTLAALREGKERKAHVISICNTRESTIARESDDVLYTHAGPEIGVASTKAFTTQIVAHYLLALKLGIARGMLDREQARERLHDLMRLPRFIESTLELDGKIRQIAQKYFHSTNFLFLGRGPMYPIALEGALKLKEISYIHAEGYAAGEMKHGPIALIDENMPVVVIANRGPLYEKLISNLEQVRSRDGAVIAIATEGDDEIAEKVNDVIYIPDLGEYLTSVIAVVPLQLLAYHIAVLKGTDVDQPRNLAKSVTVE